MRNQFWYLEEVNYYKFDNNNKKGMQTLELTNEKDSDGQRRSAHECQNTVHLRTKYCVSFSGYKKGRYLHSMS